MNIKDIVRKQYRDIIDDASKKAGNIQTPPEGWLRTLRKALDIPSKIILVNAGITKNELFRTERAELEGTVTLNKLRNAAEAMGCELYYAIVPKGSVQEIIEDKARRHAIRMVRNASVHMQLEDQGTTMEQIDSQIEQVTKQLVNEMPDWFWEEAK